VKSVCLIPGAGEFVYATEPVFRHNGPGQQVAENVHAERDRANLLVSLDQLAADFPNCDTVMLVVAWFGDDLRCSECQIRPGVELAEKQNVPHAWSAGGVGRSEAHLISQHDGAPAFGGTPSDRSVLQAIAELKQRGYKVGLYPFVLMDIPEGNALPDPYGGAAQAAYPWRGRISVHPAAGEPGAADKTSEAGDQIAAFFGEAAPDDFDESGGAAVYSGPDEWSFRRFVLHNAKLAALAGGVDAFILGSERREAAPRISLQSPRCKRLPQTFVACWGRPRPSPMRPIGRSILAASPRMAAATCFSTSIRSGRTIMSM
jgi:hypothetical protein